MAPNESATLNIGYPIYAAAFEDDDTLIVTGGGGEGKNGVPNMLTSISVDLAAAEPLKKQHEYEFPGTNDSPTALATAGGTVLVGVNQSTEELKKGINKALRKFNFFPIPTEKQEKATGFAPVTSAQLTDNKDPDEYIKLIALAKNGSVAAVVSSIVPSSIQVIDPETMKVKNVVNEDQEIKDVDVSADGSKIVYITEKKISVIQDEEVLDLSYNRLTSNYILHKVKFATDDKIICGVNLKNKAGVLLLETKITEDEEGESCLKTSKARVFTSKYDKITGMDVVNDSLIAVVGNDLSITICDAEDFSVCKRIPKVHTFAITKVAFSPNGKYLASVSAAYTINVFKIPDNIKVKYTSYYWAVFFMLLAYAFYYIRENVPREKFEAITLFLDQLVDGVNDYTTQSVLAESSTTIETPIVVNEKIVIEEEDIVKVVKESSVVGEETGTTVEEVAASLL